MASTFGSEESPPSLIELEDRLDDIAKRLPELANALPKTNGVLHFDAQKAQAQAEAFEQVLAALYRDGAVIIENAVEPELCEEVKSDMQPYLDDAEYGDDFLGNETKRAGGVVARSKASWPMAQHPLVLQLCEAVLSRQIIGFQTKEELSETLLSPLTQRFPFQMHISQMICIGQGNKWQQEHRDAWAFMLDTQQFELSVGVMWALNDFTSENGATRLYPGSHRLKGLQYPEDSYVQAVMPKGSFVFWLGNTWHSGGENVSKEKRYGLTIQYNLSFLRQEENQYLTCPPNVAKKFPRELQKLIGYSMPGPSFGYYRDYEDPTESWDEDKKPVDWAKSKL